MRTEIALLREMSNKKETAKINWVESKYEIADCLTRYRESSEKLIDTLV